MIQENTDNRSQCSDELMSIEILSLTANVVASYIATNPVALEELPRVINTVYRALSRVTKHGDASLDRREPAVPVNKSVFHDYIICLEDGKKLKMLKRHLKSAYNMTPEQYREKWGLPPEYPIVAPSYAQKRSMLARQFGLGASRKRKVAAA